MPLVHLRENNAANRAQDKLREDNKKAIRAGLPVMTPEVIAETCIENNGYETPELNDKLYLHFKGYQRIENLDAYTGCKGLFLESNGLTKIEGLEALVELRTLYLQENLLERIEGLESNVDLDTLNLSQNCLHKIENVAHLKVEIFKRLFRMMQSPDWGMGEAYTGVTPEERLPNAADTNFRRGIVAVPPTDETAAGSRALLVVDFVCNAGRTRSLAKGGEPGGRVLGASKPFPVMS